MYELQMKKGGQWTLSIHNGKAQYNGSFKSIIRMCLSQFKFSSEQLEQAIQVLCENEHLGHDTAHFGVYRTLIYTYNSKEQTKKAV